MERVTVTIGGGKAEIVTEGFQGDACLKATADLKRVMGGEVTDETPTGEMYERCGEVATQKAGAK